MRAITDEMMGAVDTAVAAGAELYGKLRVALQDAYPTATFIPLEFHQAGRRTGSIDPS
jgi:hypothetical protein